MDRWIRQQNIARFRTMLNQERDAVKRGEIERLLAEEEEKLHELDRTERRNS